MEFIFVNDTNFKTPPGLSKKSSKLLEKIIQYFRLNREVIVEASLIDDELMQKLNKEYRHMDKTTDVLSFAFLETKDSETSIQGDGPLDLGAIYISYAQADKQARERGASIEEEMALLFVHGVLHLLGYDHISEEEEKAMFALQDMFLNK